MRNLRNLVLASALGLGLTGAGFGIGIVSAQPAGGARANERHPEINRALNALRNAQTDLKVAAHDYQGHRVAALASTETAITECETCLKVDP